MFETNFLPSKSCSYYINTVYYPYSNLFCKYKFPQTSVLRNSLKYYICNDRLKRKLFKQIICQIFNPNICDNYSKTSGSLWKYYKDDRNDNLADSKSFKSKVKITGKTPNDGNTKEVEI